jgi:glycosyltransferase involved in cell wall biosynthesis
VRLALTGFLLDDSGYGEAARRLLAAARFAGLECSVGTLLTDGETCRGPESRSLVAELSLQQGPAPDAHILVMAATDFQAVAKDDGARRVGLTCWETDRLHPDFAAGLERADLVLAPSEHNLRLFSKVRPAALVPFPVRVPPLEEMEVPSELADVSASTHVFYSIGSWQERKNPIGLLTAYLTGFTGQEDVLLVLKTGPAGAARTALSQFQALQERLALPDPPPVKILTGQWPAERVWGLHRRGACYVSMSRGEAFGLPLLDAAAIGNRVIAPDWGGQVDFLRDAPRWRPVSTRLVPVAQKYAYFRGDQLWADPDIVEAREQMRWAATCSEEKDAPSLERFSIGAVADALREALRG